ncbi:zinc finger protein 558-like [Trichogramma pretiosum]|uniref:zinc finger protein 558-like n=1 Tax=Trichogramma pretiosum TaxID=7493 RepID=UPI000C71A872|nr:zinc finger protein 558-like [Trichogramma pretiosum]
MRDDCSRRITSNIFSSTNSENSQRISIIELIMNSSSDNIRVIKKEPIDVWPDAGDDCNFDSVHICEVKNFKSFELFESPINHMNEVMSSPETLHKNIPIEYRDMKPELKSLTTTICKCEHPSIMKLENKNQINDTNENLCVEFECKDVKLKMKSLSATIGKSEYPSYLPTVKMENKIQTHYENNKDLPIFMKKEDEKLEVYQEKTRNKLSDKYKMSRTTYSEKKNEKRYMDKKHKNVSEFFECSICHKSFDCKNNLKSHIHSVHNHSQGFECEICHKFFKYQKNLKSHANAVHNPENPFECNICHKSFGHQYYLKKHINTVHDRMQSFEYQNQKTCL